MYPPYNFILPGKCILHVRRYHLASCIIVFDPWQRLIPPSLPRTGCGW